MKEALGVISHACSFNWWSSGAECWQLQCASEDEDRALRHVLVCRHAPFLIAFEERAQVFQTVITADRSRRREMGAYGPQSFVTIHRDTLMQVKASPVMPLSLY